ncbi:hypothetical protein [Bradyrhizobium sp. 150]|uniref:hypothetical protein n=1 Tax=Bradyrhizobium sp. 150 TaxID=2782625 RepID=UPI001FFBC5D6|nr:hypothetical protein [Bradyrhizobium sp. 150]MCK1670739.1 hypothetical protein [Bradyrhizobium sp. 150]
MKQPEKNQGEEPIDPKALRQAEARRIIQNYIDDLRELIRKLGGKPHEGGSVNGREGHA